MSIANPIGSLEERRRALIEHHVREFEGLLSEQVKKPLPILTAYDRDWTVEERARLEIRGYPKQLCGVYMHFDLVADDVVVRRIGSTTRSFGERVYEANYRKVPHGGYEPYFDYRWLDIIPFDREHSCLGLALEQYLLQRVPTTHATRSTKLFRQ